MTYDVLLSPTFTGTAPCSPRISEITASTPPDVVQTGAVVSTEVAASILIQSSDGGLRAGDVTQTIGSAVTDAPQCSGDTISPTVLLAPSEAFQPPAGFVLISQADIDRMMALIAELQAERQADLLDQADYERLLEKERIELLTPPPAFLTKRDFSRAFEQRATE
jgi:hypothetical protein